MTKIKVYIANYMFLSMENTDYTNPEVNGDSVCSYRILTREPKMPHIEFEGLVDDVMAQSRHDIDQVVRFLVRKHGFKHLCLDSKLTYNPK